MNCLLEFKTTFDKKSIITILKENTFAVKENGFQNLLFSKHYFSGEVSDQRIRICNASRALRSTSPILVILLTSKLELTEVAIYNDTADDIKTNSMMILAIALPMAIVVILIGGILSFIQPNNYSIFWPLIVSLVIASIGFWNSFNYKWNIRLNTKGDLNFLVKLLKSI